MNADVCVIFLLKTERLVLGQKSESKYVHLVK